MHLWLISFKFDQSSVASLISFILIARLTSMLTLIIVWIECKAWAKVLTTNSDCRSNRKQWQHAFKTLLMGKKINSEIHKKDETITVLNDLGRGCHTWVDNSTSQSCNLTMESGLIPAARSGKVDEDWTKPEASLRRATLRNLTCRLWQQAGKHPPPPPTHLPLL